MKKYRAFSLIELAIVMAVLGLLVGGIMGGKAMIRSAELRSVMTDANNYITSMNSFNSQYRGLPGDITNAVNYWADAANGNGNGQIDSDTTNTEIYQVWFQLNKAGLFDQSLTGNVVGGGTALGQNLPKARRNLTGFAAYYYNQGSSGHTTHYLQNYGNTLTFGRWTTDSAAPIYSIMTPTDAFTIDTKADDGIPATGTWVASLMNTAGMGGPFNNASSCTTATSTSSTTGAYRLTLDIEACSFFIKTGL